MNEKGFYREWSEEFFQERPDRPIFHVDGTISFLTNCTHILQGIVVLLAPSSKEPCVFCANCGGFIAPLKLFQEWPKEHRDIYKDHSLPKTKLTFSNSDKCLRSFWDSEPIGELDEIFISFLETPKKKARGLFRSLGKKITKAMSETEELDEQHIWNEIRESDKIIDITIPPSRIHDGGLKDPPYVFDFSTISDISDLLLEKEEEE